MNIFRLNSMIIRRLRHSSFVSAIIVVIATLVLFAAPPASAEVTSTSGRAGTYTVSTPALLTAGEALTTYGYRGRFTTGGLVVQPSPSPYGDMLAGYVPPPNPQTLEGYYRLQRKDPWKASAQDPQWVNVESRPFFLPLHDPSVEGPSPAVVEPVTFDTLATFGTASYRVVFDLWWHDDVTGQFLGSRNIVSTGPSDYACAGSHIECSYGPNNQSLLTWSEAWHPA